MFDTIRWDGDAVALIDQRILPAKEEYVICKTPEEVAFGITDMVVRGAPAIGVTAAMGIALGMKQAIQSGIKSEQEVRKSMDEVCEVMRNTRPTAVNLTWAIDRMKAKFEELVSEGAENVWTGLEREAIAIQEQDIDINRRMEKTARSSSPMARAF